MNMRPTDEQPDGHKHPDLDDVLSQIDEMESQWRQQDDADGMVESTDRVIGGHFAKVASIDSQAHTSKSTQRHLPRIRRCHPQSPPKRSIQIPIERTNLARSRW